MTLTFLKKCTLTAGKLLIPALFFFSIAKAQETSSYQKPPKEITEIIENTIDKKVSISGRGNYLLILEKPAYPSIKELSSPFLKLAGLRINPKTNGNKNKTLYTKIAIKNIEDDTEFSFSGLPKSYAISDVNFSPDETKIAFALTTETEIQLWTASLSTREAKQLTNFPLNDAFGKLYQWAPNSEAILAKFVIDTKATEPKKDNTTSGPVILENLGKTTPARTYQDLLSSAYDEALLDFYLSAQLKVIYPSGQVANFNRPGIYSDFDFSPDGNMVMLWTIEKPYSYTVPINYFPYRTEIFDKYGKQLKTLSRTPLADNLPNGFDAVIPGPRAYAWRNDKPQTYIWVEAQDGGNPNKWVSIRDIIYMQDASPDSKPIPLAQCYLRFNSIVWGNDQIALITERWWKTRGERRVFIKPAHPAYRVNLWDRYYEDAYTDPGEFVTIKNEFNRDALLLEFNPIRKIADPNNINIFSISEGASPLGNRPFLLKFNVKTKLTDTLFRSIAPFYERPIFFNNRDKLVISRESIAEPPNYYLVDKGRKVKQLTYFTNPNPQLLGIEKKQLNYKRADQLNLSATLYLPKGYTTAQGRLPVLMWAYPREYKTVKSAGQVKTSPYQFTKITWSSPIFWATQGFAVLDNVEMPIVGESNDQPNDTFIEQLKDNATAAIKKISDLGIADNRRIAIGGHSYGAFMTANLLAHTNLFAAGIARSGAYNRTLTPFGFQAEERTLWEAPALYQNMSPFASADKIKTPLLLIHGEADDNSGTFPLQSERFYSALKGHGATTRLVLLPSEAHSYKAKESVLHMLWEMDTWLKTYVRDKGSIPPKTASTK